MLAGSLAKDVVRIRAMPPETAVSERSQWASRMRTNPEHKGRGRIGGGPSAAVEGSATISDADARGPPEIIGAPSRE